MFIFSASENMFYSKLDEPSCERAGTWPEDAVDVDDDVFLMFSGTPPIGKRRGVVNGMPAWVDVPPPTTEQFVSQAELKRQKLIEEAMQSISVIQLKLQAGRKLTPAETEKLNSTLDYIDAVTTIDTATAPDIKWPERPAV
ncbi:tail fiber assembly protein [Enterobacter roggenkampii]|uniref:tail fiber assembly protein n=1 Tax=Enterobacter roggenkampii TaxID=1812935 RepID=UPI0013F40FF5|nr:tail fiber assembly protein [Enterobacter roggenkampii]EFN9929941.1 tail fiber assembly protein [Escherichia coli]NHA27097.1 tail fiber assembly protein [Enterobacter roggenkampii]